MVLTKLKLHKCMQKFIKDQQSWQNVYLINGNHFSQEQMFHSSPLVCRYKQHSLHHHNVTQFNFAFCSKWFHKHAIITRAFMACIVVRLRRKFGFSG